jgi:hypothetical protein
VRLASIFTVSNSKAYVFTYGGADPAFTDNKDLVKAMLASFSFSS